MTSVIFVQSVAYTQRIGLLHTGINEFEQDHLGAYTHMNRFPEVKREILYARLRKNFLSLL